MKHVNILASTALMTAIAQPFAIPAHAADSPWQFDLNVSAGENDNLGRAERDRDIVEDNFASINAGAAYKIFSGASQQLTLRGFLETEQWDDVSDMSRLTVGGQLLFDWQSTAGPTAPVFQFNVSVQADDYEHDERDSTVITTQLFATKPINEWFNATIGIEYKDRDSDGTVWDLDHYRAFLSGTFAFRHGWFVHGTYSYIDGDTWSVAQTTSCNGTPVGGIFELVSASEALEPDEAFNDAFCGSWIAYRLQATADVLELGISYEFDQATAVDFSVRDIDVDARGDNEYDIQVLRASLSMRF